MTISNLEIGQKVYVDTPDGEIETTYMGVVSDRAILDIKDDCEIPLMTYQDAGIEVGEERFDYTSPNYERLAKTMSREDAFWLGGRYPCQGR